MGLQRGAGVGAADAFAPGRLLGDLETDIRTAALRESLLVGRVAHWTFDEGAGSAAADSAGSNDGTLVNGPGFCGVASGKGL